MTLRSRFTRAWSRRERASSTLGVALHRGAGDEHRVGLAGAACGALVGLRAVHRRLREGLRVFAELNDPAGDPAFIVDLGVSMRMRLALVLSHLGHPDQARARARAQARARCTEGADTALMRRVELLRAAAEAQRFDAESS